jgi:hypothetical protein
MASSDDLLNSFNNIQAELSILNQKVEVGNEHLLNICKMLTMLNMSSARNARANDLSWKLSATTEQMAIIQNNQTSQEEEEGSLTPIG